MDKSVRDPSLTDVDIHDFSGIMGCIMVVQSRGINGVVIHGQVTCTDVSSGAVNQNYKKKCEQRCMYISRDAHFQIEFFLVFHMR